MWRLFISIGLIVFLSTAPRSVLAASEDDEARVELAIFTGAYAVGLGVYTSLELDLNPRPAAWLSAGLAGAAGYGSLELGPELEVKDVRLMESAAGWAMLDTVLLSLELSKKNDPLPWMFAGGALAFAGAAAAAPYYRGTAGEISLINSGGIWMPMGGLLFGVTFHLGSGKHLPRDILVLNLAGLGIAAYTTRQYSPTREQVLTMDGGILLGSLVGALTALALWKVHDSYEVLTGLAVVGMVAGAALAINKSGFDRKGAIDASQVGIRQSAMIPLGWGTW